MENNSFEYTYSAERQQEIEAIRKKYLPPEEDKMEQLRRLDRRAGQKAQAWAVALGVMGALALGNVPYDKWVKFVWKLIVYFLLLSMAFLAVGTVFR